jgi:hypothetical protein
MDQFSSITREAAQAIVQRRYIATRQLPPGDWFISHDEAAIGMAHQLYDEDKIQALFVLIGADDMPAILVARLPMPEPEPIPVQLAMF